jgi:hypothetical protein
MQTGGRQRITVEIDDDTHIREPQNAWARWSVVAQALRCAAPQPEIPAETVMAFELRSPVTFREKKMK